MMKPLPKWAGLMAAIVGAAAAPIAAAIGVIPTWLALTAASIASVAALLSHSLTGDGGE